MIALVSLIARREWTALVRSGAAWGLVALVALLDALHLLGFAVDERRTSERALEIYFHHAAYVMEAAGVVIALAIALGQGPAEVLWRSAPVGATRVVLGRFVAGLGVATLASVATLPLATCVLVYGDASWTHVAVGALGGWLVGVFALALASAGIAIARRPLAGALGAGALLGALEIAPMLAGRSSPGLREGLARAAPVWTHNDTFRRGILDGSDVVFLIAFSYVALVAATYAMEGKRWA